MQIHTSFLVKKAEKNGHLSAGCWDTGLWSTKNGKAGNLHLLLYGAAFVLVGLGFMYNLVMTRQRKNISSFLFDAGSAEVFCTILHWCFTGLFPENRCEITLTGKCQGSRNYRDRIIGMAKHILSGLYFFILYIGTDRNSHLFCEQMT